MSPVGLCLRHRAFFFTDTATTEIYTLSLHDALPISDRSAFATPPEPCAWTAPAATSRWSARWARSRPPPSTARSASTRPEARSEEHTSELQSQSNLVCRLLLEKKKRSNQDRTRRRRM